MESEREYKVRKATQVPIRGLHSEACYVKQGARTIEELNEDDPETWTEAHRKTRDVVTAVIGQINRMIAISEYPILKEQLKHRDDLELDYPSMDKWRERLKEIAFFAITKGMEVQSLISMESDRKRLRRAYSRLYKALKLVKLQHYMLIFQPIEKTKPSDIRDPAKVKKEREQKRKNAVKKAKEARKI